MASKRAKVVDKAARISLGRKLIICCRSVTWLDEEIHHLTKDRRAHFAQGLNNDSNWSDYSKIHI